MRALNQHYKCDQWRKLYLPGKDWMQSPKYFDKQPKCVQMKARPLCSRLSYLQASRLPSKVSGSDYLLYWWTRGIGPANNHTLHCFVLHITFHFTQTINQYIKTIPWKKTTVPPCLANYVVIFRQMCFPTKVRDWQFRENSLYYWMSLPWDWPNNYLLLFRTL